MKQLILLVGTILVGTYCFAVQSGFSKNSSQLNALSSAWKVQPSITPSQNKNDITIVYGGADVSRRPTLVAHTTVA